MNIVMMMGYYPSEKPGMPTLLGGPERKPLGTNFGDWDKVMWGDAGKPGRLPTALSLAHRLQADHIIFVIGNACFETGQTEAYWMKQFIYGCYPNLKRDFGPMFRGVNFSSTRRYINWLDLVANFEDQGYNTATNMAAVVARVTKLLAGEQGLVNVVSSANHAQRVLRDCHVAFAPLIDQGQVLISATTAATCYSDTTVAAVQVKDRGDAPMRPWVKP